MIKKRFTKIALLTIFSVISTQTTIAKVPDKTNQIIVVKTNSWASVEAEISTYERESKNKQWKLIEKKIPAVVGKKGMGWGKGQFSSNSIEKSKFKTSRQEGDKRAPAGIFSLGNAFGTEISYSAINELNLKIPYDYLAYSTLCISDNVSENYNKIINTSETKKDWVNDRANEYMRKIGVKGYKEYKWGLFVNHNYDKNVSTEMKPDKKSGSCIFLHVWKGNGDGTSGCTAMAEKNLKSILSWLDKSKNPHLVQLPESEYESLKKKWNLP